MLIKITTDIVGYRTELWEVPDDTDLNDVIAEGLPLESNFLRTLSEDYIGSNEILEVEKI